MAPQIKKENGRNRWTYICGSHDTTDLLHRVQIWAKTTMHGKDLLVNDSRNWKTVEAVRKGLPEFDVISPLTLIVEPVDPIDRRALVITSQDEKVLRILNLVGQEQADGFKRLLASVDVVPKEEVVCFRGETTVFEEAEKVVVLAMYVSAYLLVRK